MHTTSDGKALYAVAVESRRKVQVGPNRFRATPWEGDIRYLHATDLAEARVMFTAAHSQEILSKCMRIVEVALAVGFFAEDDHGDVLSAD